MRPVVSVAVVAFNSEKYVAQAIDSVLAQTCADWEILFLDNGSEDRTLEIVRAYGDPRIRFLPAQPPLTLAQCRNLAAQHARGEWLAFLDADDVWMPYKLELQLARVREDAAALDGRKGGRPDAGGGVPPVGLVYARTLSFSHRGEEGETVYRYEGRDLPEGLILPNLLAEGCIIPLVSALVRLDAYRAVGPIPADYTFAEDYYLFAAVAARYRVVCVQRPLCRYRLHPQSMTARNKTISHRESMRVLETWASHIPPDAYRRRRAVYHTLLGVEAIRGRRRIREGIREIIAAGSLRYLARGALATLFRRLRRAKG